MGVPRTTGSAALTSIVRLYPRPWRERYGDELLALLDEHSKAHHPTEPHWYLSILAVDDDHRSQGLGGRLLAHTLATVDAAGTGWTAAIRESDAIMLPKAEGGAAVVAAVTWIEDDGFNLAEIADHMGPELRLDGLGEVDAGDEKFPIALRDDGETEPVAHAIDDRFAGIFRELHLVLATAAVENDDLAS